MPPARLAHQQVSSFDTSKLTICGALVLVASFFFFFLKQVFVPQGTGAPFHARLPDSPPGMTKGHSLKYQTDERPRANSVGTGVPGC